MFISWHNIQFRYVSVENPLNLRKESLEASMDMGPDSSIGRRLRGGPRSFVVFFCALLGVRKYEICLDGVYFLGIILFPYKLWNIWKTTVAVSCENCPDDQLFETSGFRMIVSRSAVTQKALGLHSPLRIGIPMQRVLLYIWTIWCICIYISYRLQYIYI